MSSWNFKWNLLPFTLGPFAESIFRVHHGMRCFGQLFSLTDLLFDHRMPGTPVTRDARIAAHLCYLQYMTTRPGAERMRLWPDTWSQIIFGNVQIQMG